MLVIVCGSPFLGVRCESFLSVSRPDDDKAEKMVKYKDLTIEIQRM